MDESREKWAGELTEAIFKLIVERSPKTDDNAVIDQVACLGAMLHVVGLLIAGGPPEEREQLYSDFGKDLAEAVKAMVTNPPFSFHSTTAPAAKQ